jgi:DNA-binding response OmpR family regulator
MQDARADGAFGADDYMPKPFNARELIARAHMQLQLGKKRRALEIAFDLRNDEMRLLTECMSEWGQCSLRLARRHLPLLRGRLRALRQPEMVSYYARR